MLPPVPLPLAPVLVLAPVCIYMVCKGLNINFKARPHDGPADDAGGCCGCVGSIRLVGCVWLRLSERVALVAACHMASLADGAWSEHTRGRGRFEVDIQRIRGLPFDPTRRAKA